MPRLKAPQRREQLIDAATKIFARFGYNATTTHAIANAAGVTEPILYRHFRNKQDLFVAITRKVSRQTIAHWEELISGVEGAGQQILIIAREFPEHLVRLADAYNVIHGALASSPDRKVIAVLKEHYTQIEKFFVGIIRRGQRTGEFRKNIHAIIPAWQMIHLGIGYSMISLNLPTLDGLWPTDSVNFILEGIKAGGGTGHAKPTKKKKAANRS